VRCSTGTRSCRGTPFHTRERPEIIGCRIRKKAAKRRPFARRVRAFTKYYKRKVNRPNLRSSDRLSWIALSRVWVGWRQALVIVIVAPDPVVRLPRQRFHWTTLSARPTGGRPPVNTEIRAPSHEWPRPIPFGAPPESMANFKKSGSTSPSGGRGGARGLNARYAGLSGLPGSLQS